MSLEFRIAARYLMSPRSSRRPSLITLIAAGGITVGIMALVVVMGVMNGLQNDLREKILIASPHLHVLTWGKGLRLDNWEETVNLVREHPEVVAATPFVRSEGIFSAGADYAEGAVLMGIYQDTGTVSVTAIASYFTTGDLDFETTQEDVDGGIVLGVRLAERLSAFPPSLIQVAAPAGSRFSSSMGTVVPKYWIFEVTGVFETGMYEYDNKHAVLSFSVAQEFAGLDDAASGIEVRVRDPWRASLVGDDLAGTLGYPYRTLDWQKLNAQLFSALQLEKLAMGLVLLLITIVAAFNIVSTLTMTVADKRREIGILKAMGLPMKSVRKIFLLQGAAIGVVGTALGTVLGLIVAWLLDTKKLIALDPSLYFIDHLPVQVIISDVVLIALASMLVAVLATLYPARRAALLRPVEAIRYE